MTAARAATGGVQRRPSLDLWPDLVFRLSKDGTILETTSRSSNDFLIRPALLIGKRIQNVPDPEVARRFARALVTVERTRALVTIEYELLVDEGERFYEARLMPTEEGEVFVIVRNASEQKRLERVVIQSEKMSAVGRLAGGIAHEINNPLGIILGFAQSLKSDLPTDASSRMALTFIENEALRCKALIQTLLLFSRASSTGQAEDVNIASTVAEALPLVLAQARVNNVEIASIMESDLPTVRADRNEIQQVVIHICSNAIEAMPAGGELTVNVNRTTKDGQNWVFFRIADNGAGMADDVRPKIFDPFFTTKEVGKGTGLGLSLVYEIVQKHHGQIEVRSRLGKGSAFTVYLPEVVM